MNETKYTSGIGFTGLLQIVFITLKLLEFIDWSWWWVLSPIWIQLIILVLILLVIFIVVIVKAVKKSKRAKKMKKM